MPIGSLSPKAAARQLADLTARQQSVLELVAEHRSSKDIGRILGIAPTTVDQHVTAVRKKFGTADRAQAARYYVALLAICEPKTSENAYDESSQAPPNSPLTSSLSSPLNPSVGSPMAPPIAPGDTTRDTTRDISVYGPSRVASIQSPVHKGDRDLEFGSQEPERGADLEKRNETEEQIPLLRVIDMRWGMAGRLMLVGIVAAIFAVVLASSLLIADILDRLLS